MSTVRILSGWSNPGGSTTAFINLTNLLNDNDIDAVFYGPHPWHLDKCRSGHTQQLDINNPEDVLIAHFVPLKEARPDLKKVIFSSHETKLFPINDYPMDGVDTVHFVSEEQRDWHKTDKSSVVIPNVVKVGERRGNHKRGAVGVIGSIDSHKQTKLAIESALISEPKGTKVLLFGNATEKDYFAKYIKPLIKNKRVKMMRAYQDTTLMYNMIDAVYHASQQETYGLIRHECKLHGIPFNDLFNSSAHSEYWEDEKILEAWKKCLEL
jgi:hypothetical protein